MAQGTIKTLNEKGFGFITGGGMVDLFFHSTAVEEADAATLHVGDSVSYDAEVDTRGRGPRAVHVRRI